MKYGENREKNEWIAKLKAEGKYKGKAEDKEQKPELTWNLVWIWHGFCFLSEKRFSSEIGPQPIQTSEMKAYLDLYGYTDEYSIEVFLNFVSSMDREWLNTMYKKKEEQMKKIQKKTGK